MYLYHYLGSTGVRNPVPVFAPAAGVVRDSVAFAAGSRLDVRVNDAYHYWLGPMTPAAGVVPGARVEAGAVIGMTGGTTLDFSVLDLRASLPFANPARYGRDTLSAVSPMQYFDAGVRAALLAKQRRTSTAPDGRINYDAAGTLAGNWFHESLPVHASGTGGDDTGLRKLSFARDVYQPARQRISIGGLGLSGLWAVPSNAPQFQSITPASGTVQLPLVGTGEPMGPPGTDQIALLLVRMLDANRIRIEAIRTRAPSAAFTARAEIYLR
jgi:hypothetical protein